MQSKEIKNLHLEHFYLQGARDLLLRLNEMNAILQFHSTEYYSRRDYRVYDKAIFNEILYNRESLVKFLQGGSWRHFDHQKDKKGKLVSVKIKFNEV